MAWGATPADTVMRNGYVYTVDGQNSVQQAIAIAGGKIVYVGSDWPVDPLDEFLALSRAEVLRSITLNAAEQLKLDAVLGSAEVGKFADLIVLDKNFMQVPEEALGRNEVLLTLVGGKVVWAKAPFLGLAPQAGAQTVTSRSAQ